MAALGLLLLVLTVLTVAWLGIRPYRLHWAARDGDIDSVRRLLDRGADPNRRVFRGPSGHRGDTPIVYAIEGNQPEAIRVLAAAGADLDPASPPEQPLDHRSSPLHFALHQPELVRALLEGGADPNRLAMGRPLLHQAMERQLWASALLLIGHGADVSSVNQYGYSAIDGLASAREPKLGRLVLALLEAGFDPNARERGSQRSLLMIVAEFGTRELVAAVITAGADVESSDVDGLKAIDYAARRRDEERRDIVPLLGGRE